MFPITISGTLSFRHVCNGKPRVLDRLQSTDFFTGFCSEHPTCKQSKDILILINSIYKTQNIFVQNAIENEFLAVMVEKLGTTDWEKQLELIPAELQIVYKRIVLEMKKQS